MSDERWTPVPDEFLYKNRQGQRIYVVDDELIVEHGSHGIAIRLSDDIRLCKRVLQAAAESAPMPDWFRVNPKYRWAWLNPVIDARYGPKFCWRYRETEPVERHEDSKSFFGLEDDYISWFPVDLPLGIDYRTLLRQRPQPAAQEE